MKILNLLKTACLLLVVCMTTSVVHAQNNSKISISGTVVTADNMDETIPYAVVSIPDLGINIVTNDNGEFQISNLNQGTYEFKISSLGYKTLFIKEEIGTKAVFKFVLETDDFKLKDVVVTATSSKTGASTASNISRTAIAHMQANSLADVMALLPGADITSNQFRPDLQGVKSQSIRGAQAMSTSVIVDGAPLSNSANMQTMTAAIGGSNPGSGGVTPSSGIDFRTITTDNIESIEIIRGVASVEYGDAASGTVIINAKAGKEPLTLRFNTNPNIYSISATHGLALGNNKGAINYGLDYAYSVADPRESYDTYQRNTARFGYSNTFLKGKLNTNTTVSFLWNKDKGEPNPDDENDYRTSNRRDYGVRITTNGTYNVNKGWFKNIKYNLAFNYTDRLSYFKDNGTNADVAYSYSKVDGSVLSSIPNGHIYDINGNEITNYDGKLSGNKSWITPASYEYEYNVYGKELNTFAKVVTNFSGKIGQSNHRLLFGADFRNDGNVGKGKVFDKERPPYRSVSYTYATQRERSYKDIPFLNRIGLFAEETFRVNILKRQLEIIAGVRYDYLFDFKGNVAPRINASYEIIPNVLNLRGAYGITYQTPSIAYIYPDNAYFDMTNFNNSLSSTIPDAQKFQVITTHVYNNTNDNLEMSKQTKYEFGFDLKLGKMSFAVTAYKDFSNNGYTFSKLIDNYKWVDFIKYKVDSYPEDGTTIPALSVKEEENSKYILQYTTPTNNYSFERKGIEFDLNFGRIDAIRTSFIVNGELYDYSSWSNGNFYYNFTSTGDKNLGVYSSKISQGIYREQNIITNFILTHNIPQLGFVISLTANVNWRYKAWNTFGLNDDIPLQYISIQDGKLYSFDPSWANETSERYEEFKNILRNEANGAISSKRREIEPSYKPVLCMNVNLTKQFNNFDVSFFANNMFRSTPLQALKKNPGSFERRNSSVFFFGLQLTARIK
jgi:Outer membrane receptor for ferrienterochelin and colicins